MFNTTFFPLAYPLYYYHPIPTLLPSSHIHYSPLPLQNQKEESSGEMPIDKPKGTAESAPRGDKRRAKRSSRERRREERRERLIKKRERLDNFQRKEQKADRNLPSNILRNFLAFLLQHFPSSSLFQRLFPSKTQISLLHKLKTSLDLSKNYIRPATIKSLCSQGMVSSEQALLMRIVLRHFLLLRFPMVVVCSSKLKKKQRTDYLKTCRKLLSLLMDKPNS